MARRGVWELQHILLRYSRFGGSSRGVREFIEHDLVPFARENPQIKIETSFRSSHPFAVGTYLSGYTRQLGLKNLDRKEIANNFMYLRNTIGQKLPTHNEVGMGVVGRKRVSIQGIWHNSRELRIAPFPHEIELRKRRAKEVGLSNVVDEVGMAGVIRIMQRLLEIQKDVHEKALAKLPKPVRTLATE